uniref:Uncharacterized protein n=1 Tax=Oryza glumipatula TaxID=40148 RepID=A0A0E0BTX5_9ORYZ
GLILSFPQLPWLVILSLFSLVRLEQSLTPGLPPVDPSSSTLAAGRFHHGIDRSGAARPRGGVAADPIRGAARAGRSGAEPATARPHPLSRSTSDSGIQHQI